MTQEKELLTINQASEWATEYLDKNVSPSNISYLIQYGRVKKLDYDGVTRVDKRDLVKYYDSCLGKREVEWKKQLGEDLNWALSFDHLKEKQTTKHVHRLHPYKGKFIPQLVQYFLDEHTDDFKRRVYFREGDIVLDPFCGSGTTLVQANELGIHAVGVDVSAFNSLVSNVKIRKHDFVDLHREIRKITMALKEFVAGSKHVEFETELAAELTKFNNQYFPSPDYRYRVRRGEINQKQYGAEKEEQLRRIFEELVDKYGIELRQARTETFLDKWYLKPVRTEIDFVFDLVKQIDNPDTKKVIAVILSRTIRTCRATTHADLGTLVEPVASTYYCRKHGKMCKPLFSIVGWWERYCRDTKKRLANFDKLRTDTCQICLTGDSRKIDIFGSLQHKYPVFAELARKQKIKGIFSSPPYVGLINYHEQHAYAYDLFGFERKDELEIGPLFKGRGEAARNSYIQGVSEVLANCARFLVDDYDIFLVANDKFSMYPAIAEKAGMEIVNQYKRPVLNRTEKDKSAYSEIILHLKKNHS